jgi:hypothetical protein
MPTLNNRGIVAIQGVTYTAVAMEQLSKRTTVEEWCFLCGPPHNHCYAVVP